MTAYATMMNLPESQRPYERLYYLGAETLSDQELIAILLGSGSQAQNALATATEILGRFASSEGVPELNAVTVEELMTIKGVGLSKSVRIIAALELGKRANRRRDKTNLDCSSPKVIAEHFASYMEDQPREELRALFLDRKNRLIRDLVVSKGGLSSTILDPRDIYREAVKANSAALILIHNHPSGDPTPSADDLSSTKRFVQAGELLGIKVHDHIILGKNKYLSLCSDPRYNQIFVI